MSTLLESDLYNLIYEIIIADHEITQDEINLASILHFTLIFLYKRIKETFGN